MTKGYRGLRGVTAGYIALQGVMGVTKCYRGLLNNYSSRPSGL